MARVGDELIGLAYGIAAFVTWGLLPLYFHALDRASGDVIAYEGFSDLTLGRRIRNLMRFAHTGEVLGIPGQTVAGLVSAGGVVLVWTGIALGLRRLTGWLRRRRQPAAAVRRDAAA